MANSAITSPHFFWAILGRPCLSMPFRLPNSSADFCILTSAIESIAKVPSERLSRKSYANVSEIGIVRIDVLIGDLKRQ
jgi:hypothetical protein